MQPTGHSTTIPDNGSSSSEEPAVDFSSFMESFMDEVKDYAQAQRRYLVMHATEKAGVLMGKAVQQVLVFVVLGLALLFFSLGSAFYLGDVLASRSLGFVVVGGLYLVLLGVFLIWWKQGGKDRFVLNRINDLSNDN